MTNSKTFMWVGVAVFCVAILALIFIPSKPGQYDAFAQCITDKQVDFYSSFTCPACKSQEALFGKSAQYLNRTECAPVNGRGQLPVCKNANISAYPTWEFNDSDVLRNAVEENRIQEIEEEGRVQILGVLPLDILSEITGCQITDL